MMFEYQWCQICFGITKHYSRGGGRKDLQCTYRRFHQKLQEERAERVRLRTA